MFSGIIKEIGTVASLELVGNDAVLGIQAPMFSREDDARVEVGDSVAISGVCLTVTRVEQGIAYFDLASSTRRVTTLGMLIADSKVNLERSLAFGDRLDGHLVQGHVDAVCSVQVKESEENTVRFVFSLPEHVKKYVAPKGSISIDGVSLTVGEVEAETFSVYIIPYTLEETTFQYYAAGTEVNIETDCIARYLESLAEPYLAQHQK